MTDLAGGGELLPGSLGWLFLAPTDLVLGIYLAFGPYGHVRLGPDVPGQSSTVSWLAMFFAAGMGAGLLFWAWPDVPLRGPAGRRRPPPPRPRTCP